MNIGSVKPTKGGYLGAIATMALDAAIAFAPVTSNNPRAPRFEVLARNGAKRWVQIGAVWEQASKEDGTMFLTGKLDDPSMVQPLYIAAFEQQDGSYNIVWSRPQRQDVMTTRSTDAGGTDNPFDGGVDLELSIEGEPATTDTGTSKSRRKAPALPDDVKDEGPF
jgi:uncharacterized protein (DUF736 family)